MINQLECLITAHSLMIEETLRETIELMKLFLIKVKVSVWKLLYLCAVFSTYAFYFLWVQLSISNQEPNKNILT